ncbi:MAG: nicotinate phosphoribosyltransferase, partial [Anaerolineae bacterium]|nr:nicotinate phosphoribosyltransferase [Anaerolineae bacterium]
VNFAFDIVEIEGAWVAKRGKMSGGKWIARCPACGAREVIYWRAAPGRCACGGEREIVNQPLIEGGRIVAPLPPAPEIRDYVLDQLKGLTLT